MLLKSCNIGAYGGVWHKSFWIKDSEFTLVDSEITLADSVSYLVEYCVVIVKIRREIF